MPPKKAARRECQPLASIKKMKNEISKVVVASDVHERDGIGVEIYVNDKCVAEIFRDDTDRTRTITLFEGEISLELMEKCTRLAEVFFPNTDALLSLSKSLAQRLLR